MLRNKPRPVPSKEALKVLYQLAYISSGTAVGVAALCAEERRRRTQVVQRIAENAKRIRQSPRYHHNAAVAVQEAEQDGIGSGVSEWVAPYRENRDELDRRRTRSPRLQGNAEAAVRGPELPSVVDAGYEQIHGRTEDAKIQEQSHALAADNLETKPLPAAVDMGRNVPQVPGPQPTPSSRVRRIDRQTHEAAVKSHKIQEGMMRHHMTARPRTNSELEGFIARANMRKPRNSHTAAESNFKLERPHRRGSLEPMASWLLRHCRDLLARGKMQVAAERILEVQKECRKSKAYKTVVGECFYAALAAGSLSTCSELLRPLEDMSVDTEIWQYHADFLQLCDAKGAYLMITDVFMLGKRPTRSSIVGKSERSIEIIAFALTKIPPRQMTSKLNQHFTDYFRQVRPAMRARIVESRTCHRVRASWQTHRDLQNVRRLLKYSRKFLLGEGDTAGLEALDRAALDIYVSANALDEVLHIIARKKQCQELDNHTLGAAVVVFAKKGAWALLDRLLAMAEESKSLRFDADTTRKFNNAIYLYARKHTATETWKFVTAAVDKLGFAPNQGTSEIMLQSFVSRRTISLIPKWLRYMRVLGTKVVFDARVALKLLTEFYLDHRPSHVIVMWLCRNLGHAAPSLTGPAFMDLVKEAIGYDLRRFAGTNASWLRSHATARSGRSQSADGVVPSPGWTWDEQLYFNQPDSAEKAALPASSNWEGSDHAYVTPDHPGAEVTESGRTDYDSVSAPEPKSRNDSCSSAKGSPLEPVTEQEQPSETTTMPTNTQFFDLRTLYQKEYEHATHAQRPERDMILALSLPNYQLVLDIYSRSVDAMGVPVSPMALEIAIEASLRRNAGDSAEAEAILADAKAAGMNVTCAMGPLLIHRIHRLHSQDKTAMHNLRTSVIDYYRMNEENGWPVKHHVGVTAADRLIRCRQPEYGIDVLSTIFRSEWAVDRPFDVHAMAVFLKGYVALESVRGIRWVVKHVLENNMRIDQIFLHTLKAAARTFRERDGVLARRLVDGSPDRAFQPVFARLIQRCYERRAAQMLEAKLLGKKLVACLAKCANEKRTIDVSARQELERSLFGGPASLGAGTDTSAAAETDARAPSFRYMERRKAIVAKAIRAEGSLGRRGRRPTSVRRYDVSWLRQYRAFLRHELVMPDRKQAAFRYQLADEPGRTLASKRRRRAERQSVDLAGSVDSPAGEKN